MLLPPDLLAGFLSGFSHSPWKRNHQVLVHDLWCFFHYPLFKGQHFQPKFDQTWWVWQVQSSQGWAWSCRGSCWEPWCWDREPPGDWSHPPAIKNIYMIEILTWLSWWYIKTWPRLVIKRMSVLLLSCYPYSIYKRIQTNWITSKQVIIDYLPWHSFKI